jgi:molybdopterin/thiamine biosynthesis adenylyltransferase
MNLTERKKKNFVLLPESLTEARYTGELYGRYIPDTGVFNVRGTEGREGDGSFTLIGVISGGPEDRSAEYAGKENFLFGKWTEKDELEFTGGNGGKYRVKEYNLIQNVFSRNTGILESAVMIEKCALILGCGSVGSLVALELARAGVGKFVLVDNDILEYHNICRHQCGVSSVGEYKVEAVKQRILDINPRAEVSVFPGTVEIAKKELFDDYCKEGDSIIVGCADNRGADVYANGVAAVYRVPFLSIGLWERAFAGEIFYWLPWTPMPCYKCALGDGGDISGRQTASHHFYTNQEELEKLSFEPGISVDINFVTTIGVKLILDILNYNNAKYTRRLLDSLKQYTLICNTNKSEIGGEMAEIFSYPLQVTTSFVVDYNGVCPPCEYER